MRGWISWKRLCWGTELDNGDHIDTTDLLLAKSREGRRFKDSLKYIDEWGVALELIEALGLPPINLRESKLDPPGALYFHEGKKIGIENTFCGVTIGKLDSLNKKIIASAKKYETAAKSHITSGMAEYAEENRKAVEDYKQALVWNQETFLLELRAAIAKKDANQNTGRFDENWLHVWSRGGNIAPQDAARFLEHQTFISEKFTRIYLTLDNAASANTRPVFKLMTT